MLRTGPRIQPQIAHATICVRLDVKYRNRLVEYADLHKVSMAEAVRTAIDLLGSLDDLTGGGADGDSAK